MRSVYVLLYRQVNLLTAAWLGIFLLGISLPVDGQSGQALDFDGVNDIVTINDGGWNDFGTSDFTVEVWVRKQALTVGWSNVAAIGKWNTGGIPGTNEWLISLSSNGSDQKPGFTVEVGSTRYQVIATTSMAVNTWYHIAGVREGSTLKIYVNGVLENTLSFPGGSINNIVGRNIKLARLDGFSGHTNMRMDELRIWGFARTAAQIQENYDCEIPTTAANLLANYHFEQGVAGGSNAGVTSLDDSAGSGRHGTLSNFALSGTASNWITPGNPNNGTVCFPVHNITQNTYFYSIQAAIDDPATADGDVIEVAEGLYTENIIINKRLTIDGAGSGSDPGSNTVITAAAANTPTVTISATGAAANQRLSLKDVRVTGATGLINSGAGVLVQSASAQSYITFDNVVSTGNGGPGIGFNGTPSIVDVDMLNCTSSNNGNDGIRIATAVPSFTDLLIDGCTIENNATSGFGYNPSGTVTNVGTGFTISNTTFNNNSTAGVNNAHDISFFGFSGNATLSNVTLTSGNGAMQNSNSYGIVFTRGSGSGPLGTVSLSDVTVQGHVGKGALTFQLYNDISNVSMTNVDIQNCVAPWGQFIASHTDADLLNIGNIRLRSLVLWNTGGVDAANAEFYHATLGTVLDKTDIEEAYQIVDQLGDKIDLVSLGFTELNNGKAYVTPNSFASPNTTPSIQRGIDAVDDGGTVHIQAGTTYTGGADASSKNVTLAPGSSPACVTITGNLTLNSGDALDMEVDGTTACTQYDQFTVNGAVTLGGATLNLALGYTPVAGDQYILIDNDGADPVSGTFAQGASLTVGGYDFSIHYAGGDGNDVVISPCLSVQNTDSGEYFCTIQAAIDDAQTLDGHTIAVAAGTYTESINIHKAVTISGPNAGTPGTGARVAEAILLNCSIDINNGGTTVLDGLHIMRTDAVAGDQLLLDGNGTNTVQNCLIERNGSMTGTIIRAITTTAGGGAKNILNNKITGDASGGLFSGHKSWNNALYVNAGSAAVTISGNTVMNCRSSLNVDDYTGNVNVAGNTFNNNGTHVSVGGTVPPAGSFTLGANDFINNPASTMVNLSNVAEAFRLDITSSTLNGTAFSALTNAQLFEMEARMAHKEVLASKKGKVIYVAGNQYVNNFTVPVVKIDKIQNSVKYADNGDVINLEDGVYNEKLTLDKSNITLQGITSDKTLYVLDGTGIAAPVSGILLGNGNTGVAIKNLTVQNFTGGGGNTHGGIYAPANNNNLTVDNVAIQNNVNAAGFYANGPIDNLDITNSMVANHGPGARGIVVWNGSKTNIAITNNMVTNNNCCGIELQDGDASAVNISNNTIDIGGGDNAIGVVGLNTSIGANTINNNIITGGGRYGIEIKNPAGGVTVSGNNVTLTTQNADLRDRGGIVIIRRGVLPSPPNIFNVDVPNGVIITGNTVDGYQQTSTSEGFGIVVEGTNHTVTGNTVNNCDVGILQQQNPSNYPGDADQSNLADQYFGRGNSPITCGNVISGNTFSSNGLDERNIGVGAGLVTNTDTGENFCSIQAAIDDAQTAGGHNIQIGTGTFNENVTVSKALTITGAGNGSNPAANTVLSPASPCTGTGFTISAPNVTLSNMYVTGYQDAVALGGVSAPALTNMALIDYCRYGVRLDGANSSVSITGTDIQRTSVLAATVGIRAGTANAVNGMTIDDCTINGNVQGMAIFQSSTPVAFDNITIKNSTISNNTQKGLYFEKLSNALLENLVMDNNGTDAAYGFNNGIDINLKYDDYSNITIKDCDITNSGAAGTATDPENPAAIAIKARDDASSYNTIPASLSGVTIKNNLITGPQNGIRFGEFGKVNNGPSNVTLEGNDLSYAFGHKTVLRRTNDDVNLVCNWHGSTDLATVLATFSETGSGNIILSSILGTGADASPNPGFQPSGSCTCPSGNLVTNTNTSETFCTIQAAIDDSDTQNGHVINVGAGTYIEDIIVHKGVSLRGPNFGVSPNTGARGPEAVVYPATSDIAYREIFHVAASNVTVDGFTIDGDNPHLTSGYLGTNGADLDAAEGVTVYETGVNNLTVSNNILKNLSYFGVTLYDYPAGLPSSGHLISDNKFQDFGTYDNASGVAYWGGGVLLYNNQYTRVVDNVMTNLRAGVQTGNFYQANPGDPAYQVISNNTMQVRRRGIFHNLHYSNASAYTLSDNTITGIMDANETVWDGILLSSLSVPSTSQNNTINGSAISNPSEGYEVWNVKNTTPALITGGTVSGVNTGVFVNNFEGYNSNAGDGGHATINGLSVTPKSGGTAIRVLDSPSSTTHAAVSATIDADCEITQTGGTGTGVSVEGTNASATVQNNDASIHGFAVGIDINGGSATVNNNHIYNNGIGVRFLNAGAGTVHTNNFYDASPNGTDVQVASDAGTVTASPNNWFAGTTYGVENLSAATVDATMNYWNAASGPGLIAPGSGAKVTALVNYCPWLDDEPAAFGGSPAAATPTVVISVTENSAAASDDGFICAGDNVTLDATIAGATAYSWSPGGEMTPSIAVSPTSTTNYSVQVTFADCTASDDQQIVVEPAPVGTSGSATICDGATLNFDLQAQISNAILSNFSWTVAPNPNVSGEADGSGDFLAQTLTNTSTTLQMVVYTVTPVAEATGCPGMPFTVAISVEPAPTASASSTASMFCSGGNALIDVSTTVAGVQTRFNWSASYGVVTGGAGSGTSVSFGAGAINDGPLSNLTNADVVVTYTITPYTFGPNQINDNGTGDDCPGATEQVQITVKPEPLGANKTYGVCSGTTLSVDLQGIVNASPGNGLPSSFVWVAADNSDVNGESTISVAGSIINDFLVLANPLAGPETVVYTVTPTGANGCPGDPFTVIIELDNCEVTILDPCTCLDNATTLANGQFSEIVEVTAPTGQTWTVVTAPGLYQTASPAPPAAPLPVTVGTPLVETPAGSGTYLLTGKHVEALGYSISVTNGSVTLSISNTCYYPNPAFSGLNAVYCSQDGPQAVTVSAQLGDGSGPATVENILFELIRQSDNAVVATQSGTGTTFNFDPSTLAQGFYTLRATFDAAGTPGCAQPIEAEFEVRKVGCGNFPWNGN